MATATLTVRAKVHRYWALWLAVRLKPILGQRVAEELACLTAVDVYIGNRPAERVSVRKALRG